MLIVSRSTTILQPFSNDQQQKLLNSCQIWRSGSKRIVWTKRAVADAPRILFSHWYFSVTSRGSVHSCPTTYCEAYSTGKHFQMFSKWKNSRQDIQSKSAIVIVFRQKLSVFTSENVTPLRWKVAKLITPGFRLRALLIFIYLFSFLKLLMLWIFVCVYKDVTNFVLSVFWSKPVCDIQRQE